MKGQGMNRKSVQAEPLLGIFSKSAENRRKESHGSVKRPPMQNKDRGYCAVE
jgi:hypothetical protein